MEFTGERAVEGKTRDGVMQSHKDRYQFAAQYCKGKEVLDIACGTGYGSAMLLEVGQAHSVVGIDVDIESVLYAKKYHSAPSLTFEKGDILNLGHIGRQFDVIISFETIEHVPAPRRALEQLAQLLKPTGLLIISTPNRALCSPGVPHWEEPHNIFHLREFTRHELQALLQREFEIVTFCGQCIFPGRGLLSLFADEIRLNIEKWFLLPICANIRPLRFYEDAFYFVPVCRLKQHQPSFWSQQKLLGKRALRFFLKKTRILNLS